MLLAVFIALIFAVSLISARLEKSVITAPMIFTLAGIAIYPLVPISETQLDKHIFLTLAEIGLVLLLFTDASRTDLKLLRNIKALPGRLLSIGMLLTIGLGMLAAKLVFPSLSIWEAGILAAILAPTDAGLGQVIVNSPLVPAKIREALNVEAGLNDGLSVPFLLFFIAMAAASEGESNFMVFLGEQLGVGIVVGSFIGLIGGAILEFTQRRGWMAESYLQLGVVALPVFCILTSEKLGASMFIAAFIAGLFVRARFKHAGKHSVEFTEEWGQVLNLSVFFMFGLIISRDYQSLTASSFLYAIISLTIVRMLPVAISLIGSGIPKKTAIFMGWFGPRGLASIVLGLVYLEQEEHLPGEQITRLAVIATVLVSIFAHGISAQPGIRWFSKGSSRGTPST